jgi:hypothetical protein
MNAQEQRAAHLSGGLQFHHLLCDGEPFAQNRTGPVYSPRQHGDGASLLRAFSARFVSRDGRMHHLEAESAVHMHVRQAAGYPLGAPVGTRTRRRCRRM